MSRDPDEVGGISDPDMSESESSTTASRRSFLKEGAACVVGACCVGVPAVAGLVAWLDPLSQDGTSGDVATRVATLDALPADGTPQRVTVVRGRSDAWTRDGAVPVGAIYLRKTGDRVVQALHSMCPHAGCFVDYQAARGVFFCPCHDSTFAVDGSINDPHSPSPRGLDALEVELKGDEVWVRFRNYRTGIQQKVPVS
jgi:menaquinol-cytochrome c reductase iron-sulfur subunit